MEESAVELEDGQGEREGSEVIYWRLSKKNIFTCKLAYGMSIFISNSVALPVNSRLSQTPPAVTDRNLLRK